MIEVNRDITLFGSFFYPHPLKYPKYATRLSLKTENRKNRFFKLKLLYNSKFEIF